MTAYLLKSTLCLLLSAGFYRLWLEQEQLPRLKRWYLVGTLLLSAGIPLISLPTVWLAHPVASLQSEPGLDAGLASFLAPTVMATSESGSVAYGWWLYGIGTMVMLARLAGHGYRLARQIRANAKLKLGMATLVCLKEETLPYTFLHYLFVSKTAYQQGKIEPELFTHELTHIRQRHTLDVLLIELLICFGWFQPLLYWYKQAIQLNHEFLADQAVNQAYQNVAHYQQLLVSKLRPSRRTSLTSTLTFQITKKRLMMMTKQTSGIRARLTGAGVGLLLGSLTIGFSTSVPAQMAPTSRATTDHAPANDVAKAERLMDDKMVLLPNPTSIKVSRKKFSELSTIEKQRVHLIPPLPRRVVTETLLSDWKNAHKYGIWIDDKRVSNERLNQYTVHDFGSYFSSKLEKNAINYGKYYYQINLMTNQVFEQYQKEREKNPMLVMSNR